MSRITKFLFAFIFVSVFTFDAMATVPSKEYEQKFMLKVEQIKPQLPILALKNLSLTDVGYIPTTHTYTMHFMFHDQVAKLSNRKLKSIRQDTIKSLKDGLDPETYDLIKNGITVIYTYFDSQGNFLYQIKLDENDLK